MGKINEIQEEVKQSFGSNSFTTTVKENTVEFDSAKDSFTFKDAVEVPSLKINGQEVLPGAGGADWNAKEGEAGYIENRPFYEDILSEDINAANASEYTEWGGDEFWERRYGKFARVSKESLIGRKINVGEGVTDISLTDINENLAVMDLSGSVVIVLSSGTNEYAGETFEDGLYIFQAKIDDQVVSGKILGQTELKQIDPKFLTNDSFGILTQLLRDDESIKAGQLNNFRQSINVIDFEIEPCDLSNAKTTKFKGSFRFYEEDENTELDFTYNGGNEFDNIDYLITSITDFEDGVPYFFEADVAAVNAGGQMYLMGNIVFTKAE